MDLAFSIISEHAQKGAELRLTYLEREENLIRSVALVLARSLAAGKKILICGNGGSAADAQHLAAELVGRYLYDRPSLPAIALSVDTSILTALSNDYGFDMVFSRQVEALGQAGDCLIAISTSGNSRNIVNAILSARQNEMPIIGLTGKKGGDMAQLCDYLFDVPSDSTPLIQEIHSALVHLLCRLLDYYLFENASVLITDHEGEKNAHP